MKTMTPEEKEKFAHVANTAINNLHLVEIIIWDVVYPHKRNVFLESINAGMSWEFAYRKAKKSRKIKNYERPI